MQYRILPTAALAAATALALAACSAGGATSAGVASTAPAPSSSATASAHSAQDVAFASGMAMHHQQAIEMADVLLGKTGVDAGVVALAKRIEGEQQPEIDLMNGWLKGWGAAPVTSSSMSGMDHGTGGGMMSAADMAALQRATGAQASTLFLTQMTEHHRGAVTMAQQEIARGTDPRAIALARRIVAAQTAEIAEMQRMLQQA